MPHRVTIRRAKRVASTQVVLGAGRQFTKHHFLRGTPAEHDGQSCRQIGEAQVVAVFPGEFIASDKVQQLGNAGR
jgi:hypothetical protein